MVGSNGLMELGPFREQLISGVDSYVSALTPWIGIQAVWKYAVCRIKKVTADSGKGCTDALLNEMYALMPVGSKPEMWAMSRRSLKQLQNSRTVVIQANGNATPSGRLSLIAPMPTHDANGVPIMVTDSILNTEPLTL